MDCGNYEWEEFITTKNAKQEETERFLKANCCKYWEDVLK